MRAQDILSYSFSAIKLRKLRAGLTTLGVVIGIAAIVALLSLSQGFQTAITAQFERGFATNTLYVSPRSFGMSESSFRLLINDTQPINSIENVSASAAIVQRTCYVNSSGKTYMVNIIGVNLTEYTDIYESTFVPAQGNMPSSSDDDSIVIGMRVHDPFQNGTILANVDDSVNVTWTTRNNTTMMPENKTYTGRVAAVLDEIGGFGLGGPSDFGVYVPIARARTFFGTEECSAIVVLLTNSDNATVTGVSEAIKEKFGGQVSVTSATAILDVISTIFSNIEIFLAGIAGISLLVAGIGIMNIMIVSLMERTREIGILKALGMKGRTVLLIFLGEASIIGLMGGAIGIGLGWGLAEIFARVGFAAMRGGQPGNQGGVTIAMEIVPILTPTVLFGALAFGLVVSVIFGLYPAWRASKLKPVEALRYE
jgi:putative ABC transport system permease protein